MVCFGSWFKSAVHHGRKVADCIAFAVRKQREMDAAAQLLFSFFFSGGSPRHAAMLSPSRLGPLESHHRSAQRFVSMVILNRVHLEIKISHQRIKDEK